MIVAGYVIGWHLLIGALLLLAALAITGTTAGRGRGGEAASNTAWLAIFGALLVTFPSVWLP